MSKRLSRALNRFTILAASAAALLAGVGAASAQTAPPPLAVAAGSDAELAQFGSYVTSVCGTLAPVFNANGSLTSDQRDLYLRCNGAIQVATTTDSDFNAARAREILGQYAGYQKNAQQSDALVLDQRVDGAIAQRLSAVSRLSRSQQVADLRGYGQVQLASNDPADAGYAGSPVREGKFDAFINGGGSFGEQDATNRELGFDLSSFWLLGGGDYRIGANALVGAAFSYVRAEADFTSSAALGLADPGESKSDSYGLVAYASAQPMPKLDLTGLVAWSHTDYDTDRAILLDDPNDGGDRNVANPSVGTINRIANGETSGDAFQVAANGYYELAGDASAMSFGPLFGLSYVKGTIDGYTETGAQGLNLAFGDQDIESLQLSLGGAVSSSIGMAWGVLGPYARVRGIYEASDDVGDVTVAYATATPTTPGISNFRITTNPADETSFELAGGLSAVFKGGMTGFVEAGAWLGMEDSKVFSVSGGLRFEF